MTIYKIIDNLQTQFAEIPADSIVSRTLTKEPALNVTLFGFAAGQSLTEHKSPMAATIQILSGQARLTLGEETIDVTAGAWIYMPPNLQHGVEAQTDLIMLLTLAKGEKA